MAPQGPVGEVDDSDMLRPLTVILAGLMLALTASLPAAQERSPEEPQSTSRQRVLIRFLTTDDFPPFNSNDEDGVLTGLNVDLARALCLALNTTCDIRTRPWNELLPALARGDGDAVIAAHRVTAEALRSVAFTDRSFHTPARFPVRRQGPAIEISPDGLDGRKVAVVRGSPHEAYLLAFFRNTRLVRYDTVELARQAVQTGEADAIFDDGISLVFWVNGTASRGCCTLSGGPYFEPRFFGDGIAIAVAKEDHQMRRMLNDGLSKVRRSGRLLELMDRYFPIRVY